MMASLPSTSLPHPSHLNDLFLKFSWLSTRIHFCYLQCCAVRYPAIKWDPLIDLISRIITLTVWINMAALLKFHFQDVTTANPTKYCNNNLLLNGPQWRLTINCKHLIQEDQGERVYMSVWFDASWQQCTPMRELLLNRLWKWAAANKKKRSLEGTARQMTLRNLPLIPMCNAKLLWGSCYRGDD